MFSYYGSKSKVVQYYPRPMYDTIIEPFAGSARYSLYGDNWKRRVILVDKYDVIVAIWRYLIKATPERILSLPDSFDGSLRDATGLCDEEKSLIGYCLNRGSAVPKQNEGQFSDWAKNKVVISQNLFKIKHWEIIRGDYSCLENNDATWFIDPPYQFGGEYYRYSNKNIDYPELREWCQSRNGQVIVCENTAADWMPFSPLKTMHGSKHTTTEAMWTNIPHPTQMPLLDGLI